MRILTIRTSQWMRGYNIPTKDNKLLDVDFSTLWDMNYHCGCCLGHAANKLYKIKKSILDKRSLPEDMPKKFYNKKLGVLYSNPKILTEYATNINDNSRITDKKRMRLLTELFAKVDINLVFIVDSKLYYPRRNQFLCK